MQGVPLGARRSRCRGWIPCALLLLAPWLVRSSLSQVPANEGEVVAVRLSFANEAVVAAPLLELEREPKEEGLESSSDPARLDAAGEKAGPAPPAADSQPPVVKLCPIELPNPQTASLAAGAKPREPTPAVDPLRIYYFLKQAKPVTASVPAIKVPSRPIEAHTSNSSNLATVPAIKVPSIPVEAHANSSSNLAIVPAIKVPLIPVEAEAPPASSRRKQAVILAVHTLPEAPAAGPVIAQPAVPVADAGHSGLPPASPVLFAPVPMSPPSPEPFAFAQLYFAEGFAEGATPAVVDASVIPMSCSSCGGGGGGVLNPYYSGGHVGMPDGCCGGPGCIPNRKKCYPCLAETQMGRFLCGVYDCICCPDPCYDPHWTPVTDAAFFVDAPRPQTQTRYRWDYGNNLIFPDRNEYFWAQANGFGLGPFPTPPFRGEKRLNYHELSLYTEVATGLIGFFFEMPYMAIRPEIASSASGFGDIKFGTKSLLYDCELFQLTFQFKTYMLSGNFSKGLGAGHVTIEPSLILGVRWAPETYSVVEVGEWVPFGNPFYDGGILRANASFNQVLYHVLPDVPLIGTLELTSWSFQSGNYTDPVLGTQSSNGYTYVNVGPGLRLVVCDKLDFGVGTSFSVTKFHWAQQLIRTEFRYRF